MVREMERRKGEMRIEEKKKRVEKKKWKRKSGKEKVEKMRDGSDIVVPHSSSHLPPHPPPSIFFLFTSDSFFSAGNSPHRTSESASDSFSDSGSMIGPSSDE
jgi:hypothetical protein